jgi:AraC-like DNA-binding protein
MIAQPSLNILSIFLLIGGVNGFVFALLLLKMRKSNFAANRFLAGILAANGILLLHQFLVESHYVFQVPELLGAAIPAEVFLSPLLYLYVRTMTVPNGLDQKTALHFVPTLFCVLLMSPFFFLEFDLKQAIVDSNYMRWPGILETTYPLYMVISGLQFTVYLALSFRLLFAHTTHIKQFFSYRENITLSWLRNFLLLYLMTWGFGFYYYYSFVQSEGNIKPFLDWFFFFSVCVVFYLGSMGLLQRRIYKRNSRVGVTQDLLEHKSEIDRHAEIKNTVASKETVLVKKYKNSALTPEMSDGILNRLKQVMESEKPYLNSNLTLPELSKTVSTPSNYLSQVINEQLQMNFFDFVNSYRIETAKQLMVNPLPHTSTILDVAMESAFNSKSAFYSAFKKQMGITPSQYKKGLLL